MKKYKPTTPSRRNMTCTDYTVLTKKKPEKKLVVSLKRRAGRSRSGRITVRHKGGGVKRMYRLVDFGQKKLDIPAKVIALEYDPYRYAFIALLEYDDGEKKYIIAPHGLKIGDKIIYSEKAPISLGNRMRLENIPESTMVYNVEIIPEGGGKLVRGAGTGTKVLAHDSGYTQLEMPSTEIRRVPQKCFASIGTVSNPEHRYVVLGKAGRSRKMGRRPTVRGSAMVPADHPHGGGEGRSPIGMKYPKTPWGKPARGVKTRKRKTSNKSIIKRRKIKKRKR